MINNNGKGGNPYHDESGKFTSKEGQGQGSSEAKSEKFLTSSGLDNRISLAIEDAKESAKYWGFEDTNEDIARGIAYDLSPKFGSFEDIKAKALEKLNQDSPEVKEEKEVKSKWNVSTLDGEILSEKPIEASSEEEAFKIAEQMYPGHGDELTVGEVKEETNPVLDKMGLDKNDLEDNDFSDEELDYQIEDIETRLIDLENHSPYGLTLGEQQEQKRLEKKLQELRNKRGMNSSDLEEDSKNDNKK